MINYLIHDKNGAIMQTGMVPDGMLPLQGMEGGTVIEGVANLRADYVTNGRVEKRPLQPTSLDGFTLKHLPAPCTVHINDTAYPCADDHAELDFAYPGRYSVRVEAFPYLDAEFEVVKP